MSTQQSTSYPLAENIVKLRKDRGLSQEQLADHLGVSRQAVSKWESGEGFPEMERIIELSNYFNITLDDLVKGNGDLHAIPKPKNNDQNDQLEQWIKFQQHRPHSNASAVGAKWFFISVCVLFICIAAVVIAQNT